jgi:RNA polymerase sigma-70 factor (ECF subfamily)
MTSVGPEHVGGWFDECAAELVLYAKQWLHVGAAEDVVQEAFVKLLRQRRAPRNVRAWLFRVVRNEAIDQLRRKKRRKKQIESLASDQCCSFERQRDNAIDAEAAQRALESLPVGQREIVILRIWGQMSLREIAGVVGKPVSTVHSRYKAALGAMKKKMEMSCGMRMD